MKHNQNFKIILVLFLWSITNWANAQELFVANEYKLSEIQIAALHISDYLGEFNEAAFIHEMLIEEVDSNYFLFAIDKTKKRVYAFKLKHHKDKLYLYRRKVLNACESKELSRSIFNIQAGEIKGCVNCNHILMTRD